MDSAVEKYYGMYKDAGFYFPQDVLTTYAISLKTKPFIILSGISGTGKTKIAQLFSNNSISNKEPDDSKKTEEIPTLSMRIPKTYDRFNFQYASLPSLLSEEQIIKFEEGARDFKERNDGGNFSDTYLIKVEDEYGGFTIGIYGQRAASPLVRARYKNSNRDSQGEKYDAINHLKIHYNIHDVLELERVDDNVLKVVSVNKQAVKSSIVKIEEKLLDRHCFISVRSDWTDNSNLFGFYNIIEQKYHIPKFLQFIIEAGNYPDHPFFVILDEMNLSKVEHYFSDVLSCLESRIIDENTGLYQEKIILHNGKQTLPTDSDYLIEIPNEIDLPTNLYITGTVNIDESTYMISPKVLDRSNVIEFNKVNLKTYAGDIQGNEYKDFFVLNTFPDYVDYEQPSSKHYQLLSDEVRNTIQELNEILQRYNLHFGYRTVNEISLYILNTVKYIGASKKILNKALDFQLVQKVFPKLNGNYSVLEEPLSELIKYLAKTDSVEDIIPETTDYPKAVTKLKRMYIALEKTGYASFIE